MSIACLRIPYFALRVALLERPELDGAPLVLSASRRGRTVVAELTPEAEARGIRLGMTPREVVALCPEATVIPADPVREAAAAERMLHRLERLSPLVEPDPVVQGCWYVDLRGLERQLGPPDAAVRRLLATVPPILRPRGGVAPGKFVASVAARQASPGGTRIVAAGEVRAFLTPVPVRWLPLPPATIGQLERLGLRTLGELAALPGAKVAARFGPAGRQAWALARGQDDDRVVARPYDPPIVETVTLPVPAVSRETLLAGLHHLVSRAFGRPALRDRQVRQVRLRTLFEGGGSWEQTLTLREPVGGPRLIETLSLRLQALVLPGAVETLTLELRGLVPIIAYQELLPALRPRQLAPLTAAVRQLKQRYGASPLYRIVEVEPWSWIPERRHALVSYEP